MKKLTMMLLAIAVLAGPTAGFAASPWTEEASYADKAVGKLEFGITNVLGGWTEIFTQAEQHHKDGQNAIVGFGKGLWNAVVYTVGGAIHTATFLIPVDIPIPDNGVQFG